MTIELAMERVDPQYEPLQTRLLEMAGFVEDAIQRSIKVLLERDERDARKVFRNEARVNQIQMQVDDLALALLAETGDPKALRFLVAAIKINTDLERIGDLAVNIVERALSLLRQPQVKPLIDIPHMAKLVQSMVRRSLDAFVRRDAGMAHSVLLSDDAVDDLRDSIYEELTAFMEHEPGCISRALDLIFVARNLERIADHATNIAEDVLFLVHGVDVRHHAGEVKK